MPESPPAHGVMDARFEQEPLSVPEFAAGGIALVAVALIVFIGVRASPPQNLSPADPPNLAVARQAEAASTAALPETAPRPSDGGRMASEWQSFGPAAGPSVPPPPGPSGMATSSASSAVDAPADSTPAPMAAVLPMNTPSPTTSRDEDAPGVQTRGPLSPAEAERNPLNRSDAASIQRRLRDLGYYFGDGNGVWGAASRKALRDFKSRNGMQEDDRWDRETEERLWSRPAVRAARTFIGGWALEGDECGHREGGTQLIINSRGAEAADGKCDFRSIKPEAASRWRIRALCSATGQAWNANIDLAVIGPNLRWSSERGTETYVRCLRR